VKLTKTELKEMIREVIEEAGFDATYPRGTGRETLPAGHGFSNREAKTIMDKSLREYSKVLRKAQQKIIKDWMSKAKSGILDYIDIVKGISSGDASRAYPYETDFLLSILTKNKIIDRFRSYFGGKKGKPGRNK